MTNTTGARAAMTRALDALVAMQGSAAGMGCGLKCCDDSIVELRALLASSQAAQPVDQPLDDALIDAHLNLAYASSELDAMCGVQWDRTVARRFYGLGVAVGSGLIASPSSIRSSSEAALAQADARVPCSGCASDIYCETMGCQRRAAAQTKEK